MARSEVRSRRTFRYILQPIHSMQTISDLQCTRRVALLRRYYYYQGNRTGIRRRPFPHLPRRHRLPHCPIPLLPRNLKSAALGSKL